MSIYIPDMVMPKNCHECEVGAVEQMRNCPFYGGLTGKEQERYSVTRHEDCPLVYVPPEEKPSAPRWISVEERLPSMDETCICRYGFRNEEGVVRDTRFTGILMYFALDPNPHWQHEGAGVSVTHWMPIPEPPEGEA